MAKTKTKAKKGNPNSTAAWRNWYEAHKTDHNKKRREAYAADSEKRKDILSRQQAHRRANPRPQADGRQFRQIGTRNVEVFRIGQVAEALEKDVQSVRIWEREGKIPKCTIPGGHRYYTEGQLELLKQFSALMTELRYDPKRREVEVPAMIATVKAQWKHA